LKIAERSDQCLTFSPLLSRNAFAFGEKGGGLTVITVQSRYRMSSGIWRWAVTGLNSEAGVISDIFGLLESFFDIWVESLAEKLEKILENRGNLEIAMRPSRLAHSARTRISRICISISNA
jgi:hypothetical protein